MRILLVRHGETVHNVAGVYAGVTDSALTSHGVLQTQRLALHLASTGVKVSHIYSSDLQRAFKTAEAIRMAQNPSPAAVVQLEMLREQDFGWWEAKYISKGGKDSQRKKHCKDEGFRDVESRASMQARMDTFVDHHLEEHMHNCGAETTVVVVAHGIILSYLWRQILTRFNTRDVYVDANNVDFSVRGLDFLGGWSNTGYLDLEVKHKAALETGDHSEALPPSCIEESSSKSGVEEIFESATNPVVDSTISADTKTTLSPLGGVARSLAETTSAPLPKKLLDLQLVVKAVNNLEHLRDLKKTRGGIGSAKHDEKQKTVDSYFKKRKVED